MLQNAYLLAKIGADTAENERKFAENLPKRAKFCRNERNFAEVAGSAASVGPPQRAQRRAATRLQSGMNIV